MPNSAAVASGQQATAAQYNALRSDVIDPTTGHRHDGVDSRQFVSSLQAILSADVSVTTAGTWYNLVSLSLGVGTWLVWGVATDYSPNSPNSAYSRLYASTGATLATAQAMVDGSRASWGVGPAQLVVASGTVTVTLQGTAGMSGSHVFKAACAAYDTAVVATRIVALRIA
jgi:hypothetical protein